MASSLSASPLASRSSRGPAPRKIDFNREGYEPSIRARNAALRILGSEDLAEDAVQEALWTLCKCDETPVDVEAWFYRTVIHRSLHSARCLKRRESHESFSATCACPLPEPTPLEQAAMTEFRDRVDDAIERLAPPLRAVMRLCRDTDGDSSDIGRVLKIPSGTVRSRLFRARLALKSMLGEGIS